MYNNFIALLSLVSSAMLKLKPKLRLTLALNYLNICLFVTFVFFTFIAGTGAFVFYNSKYTFFEGL